MPGCCSNAKRHGRTSPPVNALDHRRVSRRAGARPTPYRGLQRGRRVRLTAGNGSATESKISGDRRARCFQRTGLQPVWQEISGIACTPTRLFGRWQHGRGGAARCTDFGRFPILIRMCFAAEDGLSYEMPLQRRFTTDYAFAALSPCWKRAARFASSIAAAKPLVYQMRVRKPAWRR